VRSGNIKPESIRIRDRILPVCSHGECGANRIWDFPTCWEHLTDAERQNLKERLAAALRSGEDLKRIVLTGADLQHFDFTGADLREAFFNGCNLSNCKFVDADLHRAFFGVANLTNADMTRAELNGTVFTGAKLEGIDLAALSISFGRTPINITMRSFGDYGFRRRPHIDESHPYFAEATYRALKTHFLKEGDYDSASWASYCERLMQRKVLWQRKNYLKWITSLLFSAVCGYGEKPKRVFFASLAVVFLYAIFYKAFHLITYVGKPDTVTWVDSVYFSALTFSGMSFSELVPHADPFSRLLVTTESFGGIFALSLFVFTLTKRYVAR
jgi:Pentapeptide repeats (8 copies)/Ion channel